MPPPGLSLRRVEAGLLRPLRRELLRPGLPPEASVYPRDDDPAVLHLGAFAPDGALVGIATYLPGEDRVAGQPPYRTPGARFRGLAVLEPWRKQGIGRALVAEVRAAARAQGVKELWANARVSSLGFFTRLGFHAVSSEFEITGIGAHVVIADAP